MLGELGLTMLLRRSRLSSFCLSRASCLNSRARATSSSFAGASDMSIWPMAVASARNTIRRRC
eukprot:4409043-Lingulodinium_polyedra.AAC.1